MGRVLQLGILAGTVACLASGLVERMLFGMPARDIGTLLAAAGVLGPVGLTAGYVPVIRASRLDPMRALRVD